MSFAYGFGIALVLIPIARRVALATGLVDRPSDPSLAIHVSPVPVLGGPAVVAGALIAAHLAGDGLTRSIVIAILLALMSGLADDMRQLPPAVRLVLLGAAGIVLTSEVQIEPLGALAGVATVVLTLACANATNLIDGQNGLAGGLAAIAAAALAGVAPGGSAARSLGLAVAGAAAAFLIWNVPGRIFLGNSGAYALGTALAALAGSVAAAKGWQGLIAATACLGVFALEMLNTIVRRLRSGAPLTSGDRSHLYDIVAERSSRMRSTVVFCAAGAVAAGIGLFTAKVPTAVGAIVLGVAAVVATLLGVMITAGRARSAPNIGE
jgi:UDP-GlcNAc:undecaprenyl-phosphate GlcNAc-1-phosphate transferase